MPRADSIGFATSTAKSLAKPLPEPTQPLNDAAMKHWPNIVRAKRLSAWTGVDLALATTLARDLSAMEALSAELESEGHVLTDAKGKRYANPAGILLDQATRRTVLACRTLQINAVATQGKADHQRDKNEAARDIAAKLGVVHDLIPRAQASA